MIWIIPLLLAGAVIFIFVGARRAASETNRQESERVDAAWRAAAERLHSTLTFTTAQGIKSQAIDVERGHWKIHLETPFEHKGLFTRFVVSGPASFPAGLRIWRGTDSAIKESRLVTGDESFDAKVHMGGDAVPVMAIMDHETRQLLENGLWVAHRFDRVEDGNVVLELACQLADSAEIVERAQWLETLAERLRDPGAETPRRLAANAASDPIAGVRLANLIALQQAVFWAEIAGAASRVALADPAPEVRLAGALALGVEGFTTLSKLAAAGQGVAAGIRVEALHQLVQRAPRETVIPVLDVVLHEAFWDVRREAVHAAGTLRHTGAVPLLLARLDPNDPPVAAVVAAALGEIGDPRAEPALVEILRSTHADAATAAAHALGLMGSVAAVQPLVDRIDVAATTAWVKVAAREAIAAIQARQIGADDGQLSLSDAADPAGTLTLADETKGGQVSLPEGSPSGAEAERPSISDVEP